MIQMLRILYLEDSAPAEESVRRALAATAGQFELQVAGKRAEFERLLCSSRWDLVLVDCQPPGYDMLEIVDVVRAADARPAILIFTGHGSEAIAAEAIKRGATDYVIRNADQLQRLPQTLHATVARQRGIDVEKETRRI